MSILDFLFPKRCVSCGKIGRYFCERCRKTIRYISPNESICPVCERLAIDGVTHPKCRSTYGLDGLTSFFRYDGTIRKAVKALKYQCVTDVASEYISLISDAQLATFPHVDMCIPIPLHAARLKARGFNQAEVLGDILAKQIHIPLQTDILRRVVSTKPQVSMNTREARLGNMKNVFGTVRTVRSAYIILFDDVFTTGATMRAAANTLKRAGAKYVWAVTMAR